ncbi:MAG: hypothetical protein ACYCW6_15935 [Candidatus Xenobia bacterium]
MIHTNFAPISRAVYESFHPSSNVRFNTPSNPFPSMGKVSDINWSDGDIMEATTPNPYDNPTASAVRSSYRTEEQHLEALRQQAEGQAKQYGPGTHRLKNGDTLSVSAGPDGVETVTTHGPRGTNPQTVTYDTQDPGFLSVQNGQGSVQRNGTTISCMNADGVENRVFGLNPKGSPFEITFGLNGRGWQETVANQDGSSDTCTYGPDPHGQMHEGQRYEAPNEYFDGTNQ